MFIRMETPQPLCAKLNLTDESNSQNPLLHNLGFLFPWFGVVKEKERQIALCSSCCSWLGRAKTQILSLQCYVIQSLGCMQQAGTLKDLDLTRAADDLKEAF